MTTATPLAPRRAADDDAPASRRRPGRAGPRSPRRRTLTWERVSQLLFVVPAAVFLVLFFGYPVVKNHVMSFQAYTTTTFYTGEAPWVGFANYASVVSSQLFDTALLNTALFTVGSIVGQ